MENVCPFCTELRRNPIVFTARSWYAIRTMKASLKLILLFFAICLFGSLGVGALVVLGLDLRVLVAGSPRIPFSAAFFLRGLLTSLPIVSVCALLLVVFYMVAHPVKSVLTVVTYLILGVLTWGVIIPVSARLSGYYDRITFDWVGNAGGEDLTPHYFRVYNGNVYYYARVFRFSEASRDVYGEGLMIDLTGIRGKAGMIYSFTTSVVIRDSEGQFNDVIFKEAARMPPMVAVPVKMYMTLFSAAGKAVWSGLVAWIAFASLGCAMLASAWLVSLSSWRFLQVFFVSVGEIAVILLNYIVYAHLFFADLAALCREWFVHIGMSAPHVFSGMIDVIEPLALFVNIACIIVLFVLGLLGRRFAARNAYPYVTEPDA